MRGTIQRHRLILLLVLSVATVARADLPTESPRAARSQKIQQTSHAVESTRPAPINNSVPAADRESNETLLESIGNQSRLVSGQLRAEVYDALRQARDRAAKDPARVERDLQLMLERLARAPELSAELHARLRGQLESAIRETQRLAAKRDAATRQLQDANASRSRISMTERVVRDQEHARQWTDRYMSLVDAGRYGEAETLASAEIRSAGPSAPFASGAALTAHAIDTRTANRARRKALYKGVEDAWGVEERAEIPARDDQPIVYQDARAWQELTARRKRYVHVDMKRRTPAEVKIEQSLKDTTAIDFQEMPLTDVIDYLKDLHGIEIQIDQPALDQAGVRSDTPVTRKVAGISLRSALRLMLSTLDLTYIIKDEVLLITTPERASSEISLRVYPVDELLAPRRTRGMGFW